MDSTAMRRIVFGIGELLLFFTSNLWFYSTNLTFAVTFSVLAGLLVYFGLPNCVHKHSVYAWSIIFAVAWTVSSYGGSLVVIPASKFGSALITIVALAVIFWVLLSSALQIRFNHKYSRKTIQHYWIFIFIGSAVVWMSYLFALWPGIMTQDSLNQWGQANGIQTLSEWHPVLHTLLLRLFSKLYFSPASYLIVQVVFTSLVLSYVLTQLLKKGAPLWLMGLIAAVYTFYPMNGAQISTVWKDVPYTVLLLLVFYFTAEIISTRGRILDSWKFVLAYTLSMTGTALFRKNGFYVVILVFIYLCIKQRRLHVLIAVSSTLLLVLGFNWATSRVLHVEKSPATEAMGIPMQQIAATFSDSSANLSTADKSYFTRILPAQDWKNRYNPYTVDPLKFNSRFHGEVIDEDPVLFIKHWAKLLSQNPKIFVLAYLRQSAFLWKLSLPRDDKVLMIGFAMKFSQYNLYDAYHENPVYTEKYHLRPDYKSYIASQSRASQHILTYGQYKETSLKASRAVRYASKIPLERVLIKKLIDNFQFHTSRWFANGAFGVFVLFFSLVVLCYRIRITEAMGMLIIPFGNLLTLAVAVPAAHYRYIYSLTFSVFLILVYILCCNLSFCGDKKSCKTL